MNRLSVAAIAGSCVFAFACEAQDAPAGLIVSDVTVISAERIVPLEHAYVRILDGRIVEVSERPLEGDEEVDGTGRYLIPGLIDSHVHLAIPPDGFPAPMTPEQAATNTDLVAAALAQDPRSFLFFGFTTLVDLYGTAERVAQWNGLDVRLDAHFCGGASFYQGDVYRVLGPVFSYDRAVIFDPTQRIAEGAVASVEADGAICLKSGRNVGDTTTVEQGRMLVGAAHAAGLPVLFHAIAKETQAYAVEIGVDVIVHGMWNGHTGEDGVLENDARETLARIIRDDIGYQPTFQVLMGELRLFHEDYLARPELADVYSPALIEWYARSENPFADQIRGSFVDRDLDADAEYADSLGFVSQATGVLAEADARLLFGTDTPSAWTYANPAGLNGRNEMDHWIGAGVSEEKLFRAMTIDNARAFRLDDEIGTIEAGKTANLLLLGANPLENVAAYDSIEIVLLHGRPISRETLSARNAILE